MQMADGSTKWALTLTLDAEGNFRMDGPLMEKPLVLYMLELGKKMIMDEKMSSLSGGLSEPAQLGPVQ